MEPVTLDNPRGRIVQELSAQLPCAIWVRAWPNWRLYHVSKGADTIWGCDARDVFATPGNFLATVHPADRARLSGHVQAAPRGVADVEFRVQRPDGSVRHLVAKRIGLVDDRGNQLVAGVAQDVTELCAAHDAACAARGLENAASLAARAAEDLGQFVTRVRDGVERLAVISSNPEVAAEVDSLREACQRAAELTAQLAVIGRREAPHPQRIDLTRAVSNMVPLLRRAAGAEARVYVDCCTEPAPVIVDPTCLRRVLLHLVSHARDAMPGGGRVVLGTRASPRGATLWVGDEGPPYELPSAPAALPYLHARRGGQRANLDLAAAAALVEKAGGHLALTTTSTGGGQVEIHFPPG